MLVVINKDKNHLFLHTGSLMLALAIVKFPRSVPRWSISVRKLASEKHGGSCPPIAPRNLPLAL